MTDDRRRYHQLVFIWVRDRAMFARYLKQLPPIVGRYGGAADLGLRPTAIWADRHALPDIVNLVHYTDRRAYERFNADPEFRRIEPLRAESVDLMTFEGYLRPGDPSPTGQPGRVYDVELATYRDGGAYRAYEERGEALSRAYGGRVEYLLDPQTAPVGWPRPDLIKISSFPDEAARAAFHADPAHAEVDRLHRTATDHAVRLTGQALA